MYSLVHKMLTQHCKAVWVPLASERFVTVALFSIVFVIARLSSFQNVSHKNGECIFLKENSEYPRLWSALYFISASTAFILFVSCYE